MNHLITIVHFAVFCVAAVVSFGPCVGSLIIIGFVIYCVAMARQT